MSKIIRSQPVQIIIGHCAMILTLPISVLGYFTYDLILGILNPSQCSGVICPILAQFALNVVAINSTPKVISYTMSLAASHCCKLLSPGVNNILFFLFVLPILLFPLHPLHFACIIHYIHYILHV